MISSMVWAFWRLLYISVMSSSFIESFTLFWCAHPCMTCAQSVPHFSMNSLRNCLPWSLAIISPATALISAWRSVCDWHPGQWILISTPWLVIPVRERFCSTALLWQWGQTKLVRVLSMMPRRNIYCMYLLYNRFRYFASRARFFRLTFWVRVCTPVQMLLVRIPLRKARYEVARVSVHSSSHPLRLRQELVPWANQVKYNLHYIYTAWWTWVHPSPLQLFLSSSLDWPWVHHGSVCHHRWTSWAPWIPQIFSFGSEALVWYGYWTHSLSVSR